MVDKPVVKKPMGGPPRRPQGGRGWGERRDGGREGDRDGGRGAGGRGAWGQQGGGRGGWGQQGGRGGRGGPFGGWGNRPPFWRDQPRQTYSSRCGEGLAGCCRCRRRGRVTSLAALLLGVAWAVTCSPPCRTPHPGLPQCGHSA